MDPPGSATISLESSAETIILKWDSTVSEQARDHMIFEADRHEINLYLQAVDHIQLSTTQPNSTLQIAMSRLEHEFRNILLIAHSSTVEEFNDLQPIDFSIDPHGLFTVTNNESLCRKISKSYHSTNIIQENDLITPNSIYDLKSIAKLMITSGYSRECMHAYISVRKSYVEASFIKLGIENIGDIQILDWDNTLETKIRTWIRAVKICVRRIFASEKKLCQQIFDGLIDDEDDSCFIETIKDHATQLFNFAEVVSTSRRTPDKLFKILDIHDALSDLLPDIEIVFDSKYFESIRVQAEEILSRLAEAVRGILSEFENNVLNEPSKVPVPGGTIHPLTRYVMNYISLISDYKTVLNELVGSNPSSRGKYWGDADFVDIDFLEKENQSPLALHLIWMIEILQFNLEGKTKYYKDASLAHLFMMNNVHYIVNKIKGLPELREMIEDNYLRKLTGKFRLSATNYQRSSWVRVLQCLREEGLHVQGGFSSGVSKSALKERFKSFNAIFEDVHRLQATWLVPDTQLREELQIAISELLIPAYRSFLGRFRGHIESGSKHPEKYINYSVEDLEAALLDFFEGAPGSQPLRRRSL